MRNCLKFIIICFSIGLLLIVSVYFLNKLFPENPGPDRTIIYFPSKSEYKSAWLILDELKNKKAKVSSYFHSEEAIKVLSEKKAVIEDYKNKLLVIGLSESKIDTLSLYNCYSDKKKSTICSSSEEKGGATFLFFCNDYSKVFYNKNNIVENIKYDDVEYLFILGNKRYERIDSTDLYTDAKKVIIRREKGVITQIVLLDVTKAMYKGEIIVESSKNRSVRGIWDYGSWKMVDSINKRKCMKKAPGIKSICTDPIGNYNSGFNYNWECDSSALSNKYEKTKYLDITFSNNTYEMFRLNPGDFIYMINNYRTIVKNISLPIKYNERERGIITSYAAFVARIDNNEKLLLWVKNSLRNCNKNRKETFILNYAESLWFYCTAFSIIRPLLTSFENEEIYKELYEYAAELDKIYEVTNVNNWRMKIASVLGFAGILLNNHSWVEKAVNHLDHYLDFGIKDGVCYEGNFYLAYGFRYVPILLSYFEDADLGIIDFAKDERYQQLIAILIAQISPISNFPCYEDCTREVNENLLEFISSHSKLFNKAAIKGSDVNLKILSQLCKKVGTNGLIFPYKYWFPDTRTYINDTVDPVNINYEMLKKWVPYNSLSNTGSFILKNGGLTILKNKRNTEMLSISAKPYEQTHTHMDELSIELWIKDKIWLTNPGYRGFGEEYHSYTTSTIASNTIRVNDIDQLNSHGAYFKNFCFTDNIQLITADGSNLFIHPQKSLIKNIYLYVLISFIMIFISIKLYIDLKIK